MKKVLVIAYYTPPLGMSGVMRVTKLVKFLPRFGWDPIVLTVRRIAYYHYDEDLLKDWPGIAVHRTCSMDPARLRGLLLPNRPVARTGTGRAGRLANVLCFPDAKIGWYPFALASGKSIIRSEQPNALFATAPPFTGLKVGMALKRFSGLPLVSDFRDPWPMGFVPPPAWRMARTRRFRKNALNLSDAVLAVNQGTASFLDGKAEVIENGYDPDEMSVPPVRFDGFSIVYVGNVWENEPEFRTVVEAVQNLPHVRLRLVGGLSDKLKRELAVHSNFEHLGLLSHARTLAVMKGADLLLYIPKPNQAAGIKLYEYLGAGRPILSVGNERTEAEELIERHGAGRVARPTRAEVRSAIEAMARGEFRFSFTGVERYSRLAQAERLARVLAEVTSS
jgi:glycosyltransferase involved in cell wall biosynthesis